MAGACRTSVGCTRSSRPFRSGVNRGSRRTCRGLQAGVSFVVHEFAELADGRRLTLHEERGFTTSRGPAPSDMSWYPTLEHLERDVRTTVLPDDDDTQD